MVEKATRSVVCEVHGLRYDPASQSGCARCRRESGQSGAAGVEAAAPKASGGPPLVVWLVGVAVVAVVLVLVFFEMSIEANIGVRYDAESDSYFWAGGQEGVPIYDFACSHSLQPMVALSNQFDFYQTWDDEAKASTKCSGSTLSLRVPYEKLGVERGQVIRIATEENMGSGKVPQYFLDDALLTL